MKENASDRLKNFLVNGIGTSTRQDEGPVEPVAAEMHMPDCDEARIGTEIPEDPAWAAPETGLHGLQVELCDIRRMLEELSSRQPPDMSAYLTTREQSKAVSATVSRLEASASNKTLVAALEQISAMREDFFKLCKGMSERIDELDARTVLSSFEAYCVDMENILVDSGVSIGHFDFPRLNTLHQRIVGVVPTGDKDKDGTVAERFSDGYKLADRVLLKERVSVYKFDPSLASEAETASGTPEETSEDGAGDASPVEGDAADAPSEEPVAAEETPCGGSEETSDASPETDSETLDQPGDGEKDAENGMEEQE